MPPRKRAKASAASTPLAETQPRTPQDTSTVTQSQTQTSPQDENLLNDPWTDDQETQLLKSMMKWKPTGIHKHFRVISIHNNMRSNGFVTDETPHTRIPGIWRKLEQLFDLQALDERENAHAFDNEPDPLDPEETANLPEFELPEEEYGDLIWQKRFRGPDSDASSSPPSLATPDDQLLFVPGMGLLKDLPDGPRSQKTESVVDATPPKAKNTRASRAAAKSGNSKATKAGQAAKNTKAQSAEEESADEEDEDDDDEESSTESEEVTAAPSTRRTNRATKEAKPAPKRTRKR